MPGRKRCSTAPTRDFLDSVSDSLSLSLKVGVSLGRFQCSTAGSCFGESYRDGQADTGVKMSIGWYRSGT